MPGRATIYRHDHNTHFAHLARPGRARRAGMGTYSPMAHTNTRAESDGDLDGQTIITSCTDTRELRYQYALGLRLIATATYTILPPAAAPVSGSDWPTELDYPYVLLVLRLPSTRDGLLDGALRSPETRILGEALTHHWGLSAEGNRWRETRAREETTVKAHQTLRHVCEAAVYELRHLVRMRALRLSERDARIEATVPHPTIPCPPWFELERGA